MMPMYSDPGRYRLLFAAVILVSSVLMLALWGRNLVNAGPPMAKPLENQSDQGTGLLCAYGVNVIQPIGNVDLSLLHAGWYLDYRAEDMPIIPNGMEYVLTVRLTQVGSNGYTYRLNGSNATIQTVADANPGAIWLISNEPDRRDYQDDIEPHVYATAYHDLYVAIKAADPTARVYAGTIVQPTPIRLQYLDLVLFHYLQNYGTPMPVDGWSIHNFILNEVSCDYDPTNCWGAEVPPGIDEPFGEIISVDDNANITVFQQRIIDFRQWMKARGYSHLPLTVSEYGVLMPADFGFPPAVVNQFMSATFDFMETAVDPQLGDPNDNFHLVQTWSWYSTGHTGDPYNGFLYEETGGMWVLSEMGENFRDYTAVIPDALDFYPSRLFADVAFSQGDPVTVTLKAQVANSGNLATATGPVTVRFYDGHPQAGGMPIGADQSVTLAGCGRNEVVQVVWPGVPPGAHEVYVVVDPEGSFIETNETNNITSQMILVATERAFLPLVSRPLVIVP